MLHKKRKTIHLIRQALEEGSTLRDACISAGTKQNSIHPWYKKNKRLEAFLHEVKNRGRGHVIDKVEQAFINKLKEGKGSGSEYEFFLTNKKPTEWKKRSDSNAPVPIPLGTQMKPPIINYISVSIAAPQAAEPSTNGQSNGRVIEHV